MLRRHAAPGTLAQPSHLFLAAGIVAKSDDVPIGKVKPVTMMDRELVVFRTEDGVAHVTNAHCPHFGVHLGHGGLIKKDCIRRPFHGLGVSRQRR